MIIYIYIDFVIFNIFKSKPTLKELIPNGFVDIHSHILPGIDDGAKDVRESLLLISCMKKLGFSKMIFTPHTYPDLYENTNESIKESFKILNNKLKTGIDISYASEYMIDKSLIEKAQNRNLLCLKDDFVLIEMNFISIPIGLYEIIYEIRVNGFTPILAHPERYLFLSLSDYQKLKKFGCLFQANLLSTTNYYGLDVRKNLDLLIKKNYIDFVGSDIHHMNHILAFESKVDCKEISTLEKIIDNNNLFK